MRLYLRSDVGQAPRVWQCKSFYEAPLPNCQALSAWPTNLTKKLLPDLTVRNIPCVYLPQEGSRSPSPGQGPGTWGNASIISAQRANHSSEMFGPLGRRIFHSPTPQGITLGCEKPRPLAENTFAKKRKNRKLFFIPSLLPKEGIWTFWFLRKVECSLIYTTLVFLPLIKS